MFISLLLAACPSSLPRQTTGVGTRAFCDDCVERVGEHAARTAIQAADVGEVSGIPEILLHEPHAAPVVQAVPDLDRLRRKATIRESDRQRRVAPEYPTDFAQHLYGPGQVVDGDADPGPVELRLFEGQPGF